MGKTVFVAGGLGLDRAQLLAGGECCKKFMYGVGGDGHDLFCSPQCPGGMQVLEGQQIASDHLFSADDMLQDTFVLDSCSSVPDSDGGCQDGLNDGCIKVHHHWLWYVELFQLLQEVHPLLSLLAVAAEVQFPLEVLADDGSQEVVGLLSFDWGVTQDDVGELTLTT